jgi:tetratricopeptide (TPR) repeat protein
MRANRRRVHTLDFSPPVGNIPQRRMPQKRSARNKKLSRKETRDLDVKIRFLEGVVTRDPQYVEALQVLGDHYTQRGRFEHSLTVDQRLARLEPRNPLVFYNLACSYSLNRDMELAVSALEKALSLGYRDFKWLAKDPDLRSLRQHPLYRNIADKIRRMKVRIR